MCKNNNNSSVASFSNSKNSLVIEYALITDNFRKTYRYLSYVDSYSYLSDTLDGLVDDIRSTDPYLFEHYNIILKVVGS